MKATTNTNCQTARSRSTKKPPRMGILLELGPARKAILYCDPDPLPDDS